LAGETEVLGENLPQRHFVHHKSHLLASSVSAATPQTSREENPAVPQSGCLSW
jgi:hypothetical protein